MQPFKSPQILAAEIVNESERFIQMYVWICLLSLYACCMNEILDKKDCLFGPFFYFNKLLCLVICVEG